MPNPIGRDPAAPSANAARTVPPRPRPMCSHAGGQRRDQHQRADARSDGGARAAAPAMPVSATTGAAAMTQSARPATTGTPDRRRATTTASSRGHAARGRQRDRDLFGERTGGDLAQPQQHDRSARDGAGCRPGGGRGPASANRNECRREEPHDTRRGPRPGNGRAHRAGRNHREVGGSGDAQELDRGDHQAERRQVLEPDRRPAHHGRGGRGRRWSSAACPTPAISTPPASITTLPARAATIVPATQTRSALTSRV